jgi:hypothetical protein
MRAQQDKLVALEMKNRLVSWLPLSFQHSVSHQSACWYPIECNNSKLVAAAAKKPKADEFDSKANDLPAPGSIPHPCMSYFSVTNLFVPPQHYHQDQ